MARDFVLEAAAIAGVAAQAAVKRRVSENELTFLCCQLLPHADVVKRSVAAL